MKYAIVPHSHEQTAPTTGGRVRRSQRAARGDGATRGTATEHPAGRRPGDRHRLGHASLSAVRTEPAARPRRAALLPQLPVRPVGLTGPGERPIERYLSAAARSTGMRRRTLLGTIAGSSLAGLAGCSSDGGDGSGGGGDGSDGDGSSGDGGAEENEVAVGPGGSLTFSPETIIVSPGTTVTWTFESASHNVSCNPDHDSADAVSLPEDAEPFASYGGRALRDERGGRDLRTHLRGRRNVRLRLRAPRDQRDGRDRGSGVARGRPLRTDIQCSV